MYVVRIRWPREEASSMGWLQPVLDAQVASTFIPPIYEGLGRYRVAKAPELDVQNVPQPSFAWASYVTEQIVTNTILPTIPEAYRVREGVALDVRNVSQPAFSWVFPVVDADVAIRAIPPLYALRNSYQVAAGPRIDVRDIPQPEPIYHQSQVLPPNWAPIAAVPRFRTAEGPTLDVRNIPQPFFNFTAQTPVIRTTQILAEIVIRPHAPTGTIEQPPPILFDTHNVLVSLTGPAQAMEICSGYVGQPPILTQLQQLRAHYTTYLAPRTSALHPVHTPQIGRTERQGPPGVFSVKNSWFNMRQTDRYHRVCLNCTGDTEITGLTWMLREAGIR